MRSALVMLATAVVVLTLGSISSADPLLGNVGDGGPCVRCDGGASTGASYWYDGGNGYIFAKEAIQNPDGGNALMLRGPVAVGSFATGSLPAAATVGAGALAYDSTLTQPTYSDGTAWIPMGKEFTVSAFRLAGAVGNTIVAQTRMQGPGTLRRLTSTEAAVGVGVGTYTVDVYDVTTTTTLCTSSAIACTTAVGNVTGKQCTGASFATSDDIAIRVNDSGCATAPSLSVVADFGGF